MQSCKGHPACAKAIICMIILRRMCTIFTGKILRLHAVKIGAGSTIRKNFMTFPIHKNKELNSGMKIIVATGNRDKVKEIREILQPLGADIVTMKEAGLAAEPEENGTTFQENAIIKAKAVAEKAAESSTWKEAVVLADDSGLVIDALDGEPGIYSARYLGHDTSYREKNSHLMKRLEGVEEERRSARFVCAVAAVCPDGKILTAEGTMEGRIGYEERGENGFGYDPIFYLPEFGCSCAELSPAQKNSVSHRGKAFRAMGKKLGEW